jgi:hypothetical protein
MLTDFLLPKYDKEAAIIPKGAARWLPTADVAVVPCPPINANVPRISVLAQADGKVEAVTAHGFMARGNDAKVSMFISPNFAD